MDDKRKRCVAFEEAAKRMLKYLEDSEDLRAGLGELTRTSRYLLCRSPNRQGMKEAKSCSRSSGKKRMRCTSPFGEVGYTTERFGGAGKALSGPDAGGCNCKAKEKKY